MTLPFISYGGSSLLALGLGMGFLIALTRRNLNVAHLRHGAGAARERASAAFFWRRAARAAICFPPPRSRRRWRGAASRSISPPTTAR